MTTGEHSASSERQYAHSLLDKLGQNVAGGNNFNVGEFIRDSHELRRTGALQVDEVKGLFQLFGSDKRIWHGVLDKFAQDYQLIANPDTALGEIQDPYITLQDDLQLARDLGMEQMGVCRAAIVTMDQVVKEHVKVDKPHSLDTGPVQTEEALSERQKFTDESLARAKQLYAKRVKAGSTQGIDYHFDFRQRKPDGELEIDVALQIVRARLRPTDPEFTEFINYFNTEAQKDFLDDIKFELTRLERNFDPGWIDEWNRFIGDKSEGLDQKIREHYYKEIVGEEVSRFHLFVGDWVKEEGKVSLAKIGDNDVRSYAEVFLFELAENPDREQVLDKWGKLLEKELLDKVLEAAKIVVEQGDFPKYTIRNEKKEAPESYKKRVKEAWKAFSTEAAQENIPAEVIDVLQQLRQNQLSYDADPKDFDGYRNQDDLERKLCELLNIPAEESVIQIKKDRERLMWLDRIFDVEEIIYRSLMKTEDKKWGEEQRMYLSQLFAAGSARLQEAANALITETKKEVERSLSLQLGDPMGFEFRQRVQVATRNESASFWQALFHEAGVEESAKLRDETHSLYLTASEKYTTLLRDQNTSIQDLIAAFRERNRFKLLYIKTGVKVNEGVIDLEEKLAVKSGILIRRSLDPSRQFLQKVYRN